MSAFRIQENGIAKNEILQTEGVCPECGNNHTEYFQDNNAKHKRIAGKQFHYRCPRCGTKWVGEIYSYNLEKAISL